jgi:L-alanine-DL-glutamate epimerase-like enolase superfamily enzyme
MKLTFHPFDLQLHHTFTIAHDSRDVQPTLVVQLHDGKWTGLGEATSNKYYGVTIEGMIESLNKISSDLATYQWGTPEELWDLVRPQLKEYSFAQCALDQAAHDLYAKKQGKKLYEVWGFQRNESILTNYTIGIDTIEKMVAKLQEIPWPLYKIKLGTEDDLAIIKELRKHTDAVFRVDANCGWDVEKTLTLAPKLKDLGVEFIEQPLPAEHIEQMKEVFERCALPVIADENCIQEEDVEKCAGYFHGVNVKLTKCGGLTPALRMLKQAKSLGMQTMVGCMTETSVGISAIGHLLPLLDYVDMDGTMLISNDPATGVTFDYGRIIFPNRPGTGALLK